MSFVNKLLGSLVGNKSDRDLKELQPYVDRVKKHEAEIAQLSNNQLRDKTAEFKQRITDATAEEEKQIADLRAKIDEDGIDIEQKEQYYDEIDKLDKVVDEKIEEALKEILPEAFGVIKETAKRFSNSPVIEVLANEKDREFSALGDHIEIKGDTALWHNNWIAAGTTVKWEMVHYDVQLIGGAVLHQGKIAEMATGEGKTLVATLPVYLNALPGKGVHVVTVNDYLAKRDSEWMAPIFQFHGLSIDCIDKHQPNSDERRKAYLADITYGTNNEFGFDYLRDNMARSPKDLVQRKHNYAIVDEVDSVLIDDARTPLIISGPVPQGDNQQFDQLKPHVDKLVKAQRAYVNGILAEAKKLIAAGNTKEGGPLLLRAHRGLPKNKAIIKYLSEDGIRALLQKSENFHMQDQSKQMKINDAELYFVIEEKQNNIELTDKGVDLLSEGTDASFFIMPDMGSEIAELEKSDLSEKEKAEKKDELMRDFGVKSERIHTMNQLLKAYTLFEKDTEYVLMDNKVKIVDEQTGRIMDGRRYSDGLHQAIEAKENVKIEAATQTFASVTLQNYFRMYKKLSGMTGTAETEAGEFWDIYKLDVVVIPTNRPIARKDDNDLVYKTKREKYNAVIEEIVTQSQAGRPVLVGTTSVEISELLSRALNMRKIKHNVLNAKLHKKEADVVAEAGMAGAVTIATNMAGRGTDIKISDEVKAAGGLAIIGTERHDSRRVDRQLRGRAGRQGDPGSSQFYVSLEDNLMRLFGSERIAKLMDRMGHEEGEVIQHGMISKSIERAQKKVEENNFGVRKRLLEYDDVMNSQREVMYKRRRHALHGERLAVDIANMMYQIAEMIVSEYHELKDYESFKVDLVRNLNIQSPVSQEEFDSIKHEELVQQVFDKAYKHYEEKNIRNAEIAFPVIKDVLENQGGTYENIVVPFTDGIKTLQVVTNLQKAYDSNGKQLIKDFEKGIVLAIIDEAWKEHLRELDDLKQSVQNASLEQKDPLLIYKLESFELFKQMIDKSNRDIVSFLFKGNLPSQDANQVREARQTRNDMSKTKTSRESDIPDGSAQQAAANRPQQRQKPEQVVREERKIGRNERVTIQHVSSGESKEVKYKVAEPMLTSGQWIIVENRA